MSTQLKLHHDGPIAVIELDRPEKRNALSEQLLAELIAALDTLDGGTRIVVLRALPGAKVFSAGHDIDELPLDGRDPLTSSSQFEQALERLRTFPLPIIAQVSGGVWGGAVEFVLSCDLVLADASASFAVTPAKLGLPYNTAGVSFFLSRLPAAFVKELFLTAQTIDAEAALRHGLITRLLPAADLAAETLKLARWMAELSPRALRLFKRQIAALGAGLDATGGDQAAGYPLTGEALAGESLAGPESEAIEALRAEMYAEGGELSQGVTAFKQRTRPEFRSITD